MGLIVCALVLALTGTGSTQPRNSSPAGTAPSIASPRQTAPEEAAQSSEELTTPEVQQLIHEGLSSDPALAGASVSVQTDDRAIVLMGSVGSEKQHEVALRIAQSFTGNRQIVDKIKLGRIGSE